MKRFTKVYKAPGYPVDPKAEEQRIWERKWGFVESLAPKTREEYPRGWDGKLEDPMLALLGIPKFPQFK